MKKKTWVATGVAAAIVLVLGASVLRAVNNRNTKQQEAAVATANLQKTPVYEVAPQAYAPLQPVALDKTLLISGSVEAVKFAAIRSAVAADVIELLAREGQAVKAGQPLVRLDDADTAQRAAAADRQAAASKAQLDIAKRQLDNNKALSQQGFISATALDTTQANFDAAQANYDAAKANAAVARKAQQDTLIRAPFAGVVAQVHVNPGDRVAVQAAVVDVVGQGALEVAVAVPVAQARGIRAGQKALLTAEGLNKEQTAVVARVAPSVNTGSRQVMAYLSLPAQTPLRHGEFVQGELLLDTEKTLAVPVTAVMRNKPQPYVQVIDNQVVKHVTVSLGAIGRVGTQQYVQIDGLAAGSVVLLAEAGSMAEGTQLKLLTAQ
ncbi:MAG: Macrolide export protein MacA [Pseudomonadota bacterium]